MNLVETANRIRGYVTAAVAGVMVYALYVSMAHITHVATYIGIPGWQARTAFLLVDLPALIGKVLQMKYFAQSTRKTGRRLTYFSGAISLACNVLSGVLHGSAGAAGWGAFVVIMFLVLESVITKIKPAAAVTRAKNAAEGRTETTTTSAPAEVGPRGGQKWTAERRAKYEAAKLEKQYALASVSGISPVSPA
jgi:hypothetical protein